MLFLINFNSVDVSVDVKIYKTIIILIPQSVIYADWGKYCMTEFIQKFDFYNIRAFHPELLIYP